MVHEHLDWPFFDAAHRTFVDTLQTWIEARVTLENERKRTAAGFENYKIASMPLRLMTSSRTSAGPVGRFAPRSSCDT